MCVKAYYKFIARIKEGQQGDLHSPQRPRPRYLAVASAYLINAGTNKTSYLLQTKGLCRRKIIHSTLKTIHLGQSNDNRNDKVEVGREGTRADQLIHGPCPHTHVLSVCLFKLLLARQLVQDSLNAAGMTLTSYTKATKPFEGQKPGTSGLRKAVKVFEKVSGLE